MKCDFCNNIALYDVNIALLGGWANVCQAHFNQYGCKLGLGYGQKLKVNV